MEESTTKTNATKLQRDLSLVHQERFGDLLFLMGTILAIISTYQAEESITSRLVRRITIRDYSAHTIAWSSWLFFIASVIFTRTATIRLNELRRTRGNGSNKMLRGVSSQLPEVLLK